MTAVRPTSVRSGHLAPHSEAQQRSTTLGYLMFRTFFDEESFRRENLHLTRERSHRLAELDRRHHVTVYVTDVSVGTIEELSTQSPVMPSNWTQRIPEAHQILPVLLCPDDFE
jgi:hypothetical protein